MKESAISTIVKLSEVVEPVGVYVAVNNTFKVINSFKFF
jgi:hypothetical protein